MSKTIKGNQRHLTLSDRSFIEQSLTQGSTARNNLNGATPYDLARLLLNKKVLTSLGLHSVSPDHILLKPALLK